MARVVLSPAAANDFVTILAWSEERFGAASRLRYQTLVADALEDLAENPERLGSEARPEIAAGARTYHLFHSRRRASRKGATVGRPRHFVLYRISPAGDVEVGRILHDAMDLDGHLPPGYAS